MTATLPPGTAAHESATPKAPVDREALSARLLGSAAERSADPVVDIDWDAPIPVARRTPALSAWQLRKHRTVVAAVAAIVAENLVQPEVYASVGLDPGTAKAAARADEHYAATPREASTGLVGFLRGVGLIGGSSQRLWKRAQLLWELNLGRAGSRTGRWRPRRRG